MKTGRNDLCPCGSGKKYKKCCLEKDMQNYIAQIATTQSQPQYRNRPDEWEPEDEPVDGRWDENLEEFEEDEFEENPDEDNDEEIGETEEMVEKEDTGEDDNEDKPFIMPEVIPERPEISEEEKKLVDKWWDEYKKMERDTVKEREHLVAFINQYPHLVDHLELWHEVLFELGAHHYRKGIYETYVELLLRIRKEHPITYKQSFEYYDSDMIYWFTAQGCLDEIDTFFSLFREDGNYGEKLDNVVEFLRAIDRTDILLASLAGSKCRKHILSIIGNDIVSRYLDQPVSEASLRSLSDELLSEGVTDKDTIDDLKESLSYYLRPFTVWDNLLPRKRSEAQKYYYLISANFIYFLYIKTNLSFDSAVLFSGRLNAYYQRIIFSEKRPADPFCLNHERISKHVVSFNSSWLWGCNMECFIELNALYYFAAYLKTCGNISEDQQHEIQKLITNIYQNAYEASKNEGPEMLAFTQFPLYEINE